MTELVLEGRAVRLEPMRMEHAQELCAAASPDLFKYFLGPSPLIGAEEYVRTVITRPATITLVVRSLSDGRVVGSTSFLDIRPDFRCLEIGSTWIAKNMHGSGINTEMKLLMLSYAFEQMRCVRVLLKTDGRNLQSQRAIEKLGAQREGVMRKFGILSDGYIRDAVIYSILDDEWPDVKARLTASIEGIPQ